MIFEQPRILTVYNQVWLLIPLLILIFFSHIQVIMVSECSPIHSDYMQGMQGLLRGLVPRAFLELLDD